MTSPTKFVPSKPELYSLVQDNNGKQYSVLGLGSKWIVLETIEQPPVRVCFRYSDVFPVLPEITSTEEYEMEEFKKELERYS